MNPANPGQLWNPSLIQYFEASINHTPMKKLLIMLMATHVTLARKVTVDDELESLDIKNIASTIRAIALSSKTIVEGTDTPKRIDKATVR